MSSRPAVHVRGPSAEQQRQVVEDVISHPLLHGSEALCHLLRYLAVQSLDHPQHPPKEHQIATEVFGRPASFDPRIDSTVRVQTSRLRSKLAEYYSTNAPDSPWQVEIPKGSYSVLFHERVVPPPQTPASPLVPPVALASQSRWPLLLALLISAGAIVALVLVLVRPSPRTFTPLAKPDSSLAHFWRAVLPQPEPPLVVFSNAEFVGRPENGLRYRQPGDAPSVVFDQYTGVGEVMAIHEIDNLFDQLGRRLLLKRGRLLNWDDTKNRDLIFIGSPSENLPVRELPPDKDFVFKRVSSSARPEDLGLVNLHPRPGEQAVYFGSKQLPITDDYALIEFSSGAVTSRRMLLLAGTTTFGTQGAVEFVCREGKIASILARFKPARTVSAFSAVLHVRIQGGVPLDSEPVAFRTD